MKNFWEEIKEANNGVILALAPMADVTDSAFRHLISKNSDVAHVTYSEFVSADGLVLAPDQGRKKLLKDLEYTEIERPIVAQFFTSRPENMEQVARLAASLGFDGVDINMGCPDKTIEKQGAGACLIKNPSLARELIKSAKAGVRAAGKDIPVSVKTRIGYNQDELEAWLPELLKEEPSAIILHLRTRKEMSKVLAHWDRLARAVAIRNARNSKTLIIGNGDIMNVEEAKQRAKESHADGVMLGRAVFGNPFLFRTKPAEPREALEVLKEHINLFHKTLGDVKSFAVMKKHFKAYLKNVPNSTQLKDQLLLSATYGEATKYIDGFLSDF